MRPLILALSLLFAISACSQNEPPRPETRIPAELTADKPVPVMHGTTNRDVRSLIARLAARVESDRSRFAAIRCIEDARQAIIDGDDVPECAA